MKSIPAIRGAGSGKAGGSAARVPIEARDSLRSISLAKVIDLIAEGEIEGLVNGDKSIYLNGTPLQNDDEEGSYNFTGVSTDERPGTQGQAILEDYQGTESEFPVSTEVKFGVPVVKTITNETVDAARVRLAFPALSSQNVTNGDLSGTSVKIAIEVQANGGGYVTQIIGFEWQSSINPSVLTSIGLAIDVKWIWTPTTIPDPYNPRRSRVVYTTLTYDVQYRQVGAGGWTTLKRDSVTSADAYSRANRGLQYNTTGRIRTYTKLGLPELIYEVRTVIVSGSGSATVTSLRILTPTAFDTITGKSSGTYQRSYRIKLIGTPPWDIRVSRLTVDSVSAALQNKTFWDTYAEIVDEKFTYPNSALIALTIDAAQFSSIPTRGYDVRLLKVKIPSNYDPVTRIYSGIWDGTFIIGWTDNPAWCFYDLLTNTRYGLGNYLPEASVDKWGLYTIAQYCDGMVDDGFGNEEPRFRCNIYLQTREEAFQVIATMASVFRGMAYWAGGVLLGIQDAPSDPVFLFTEANVIDGLFSYSGTSKTARHTVALVSWSDPDDGYLLKPEYVEDLAGIALYGVNVTEVAAVGAVSRGQAHRLGKWILYSERLETEAITFTCGLDGIYLRPGAIFAVQDQHRAGIRFGGRLVGATTSSVTLDQAVTIESGKTYTIQVVLPNGTLDTKTITTSPGTTSSLTISGTFAVVPVSPAVWLITSSSLSPRLYRALSIIETDRNIFEVSGIEHNASKFDAIEASLDLFVPNYSTITTVPRPPQNVTLSESLRIEQGSVLTVILVRWDPVQTASRYTVEYRRDSGNYVTVTDLQHASMEVVGAIPGFYEVRVTAQNILQSISGAGTGSRQIFGKTAPPADVTNFVAARNKPLIVFSWKGVSDLDLSHYVIRQGASWAGAISVVDRVVATRFEIATHIGGTYLIKAVDTSGNYSVNAAVLTLPNDLDINVVVTGSDNSSWTGVKVNTQGDSVGLTLANTQRWNTLTNTWNTYTSTWYQMGTWASPGTYETVPIDLGVVLTSRIEVEAIVEQVQLTAPNWLTLTSPWLSYDDPWTGTSELVSATYEIATSQDGAIYTAYGPFQSGVYTARAVKFKITLTSTNSGYIPRLKSFIVTVDVPDRVVHFEDRAIGLAGTNLLFSPAFIVVQTVTGTIQGGAIGDTFRVTSKSTTHASVSIYDSAGNPKAGIVDIDVFGYGEK